MKRYTSCVDGKTGYELILTECSYNEACEWLEDEMRLRGLCITGVVTMRCPYKLAVLQSVRISDEPTKEHFTMTKKEDIY